MKGPPAAQVMNSLELERMKVTERYGSLKTAKKILLPRTGFRIEPIKKLMGKKPDFSSRGEYNSSGGRQLRHRFDFRRGYIEVGYEKTPSPPDDRPHEYYFYSIRFHSWDQGRWDRHDFLSFDEMFKELSAQDVTLKALKGGSD